VTTPTEPAGHDLARRLARFRAAYATGGTSPEGPLPHRPIGSAELAERLATTLDGVVVETGAGRYVRIERPGVDIAVDRDRLARLPGQPAADRPLVCLDTETTGLATAAGTVAFCIGLGWWQGPTFRQVQLLLPDHADEVALLEALASHIPRQGWLVTYNGRGFDWPLLVARYRMARRAAPAHDGHLDLLPIVRRVFRHRMVDARLRTAEETLLGMHRHDDVDGWEIPARYLGFLRGGPAHPLLAVVRHNDEDVRSLARLIALLDRGYATPDARRTAPAGDLAGLARAFVRTRRLEDALACLEEVIGRADDKAAPRDNDAVPGPIAPGDGMDRRVALPSEPWWSPRVHPDFGGRPRRPGLEPGWARRTAFDAPWDSTRIAIDRAHLLRRLGHHAAAADAWLALASGPGRIALVARIEIAKLREHRLGDRPGALAVALEALAVAERRRRLGLPEPSLEADLHVRVARLRRLLSGGSRRGPDLRRLARDHEAADPFAQGPIPNGHEVGHTGEADPFDHQRAGRRGEPQVRADAPTQRTHQ
jgi:uncharacterized protein YprB with RNaseH-like and TPR domain